MKFGKIDNLIVFGGSKRAINLLAAAGNIKKQVISAPRYLEAQIPSVNNTFQGWLKENNVDSYAVDNIADFDIDSLIAEKTLAISLGAPWIFRKEFIKKFNGKLLNGHGAKLPTNRGAGGYSWQIMQGLNFGYHLLHQVDEGIDSGKIVHFNEFLFPESCKTPEEYENHSTNAEIDFFKDFFEKINDNFEFQEMAQQEYFSTYFPRLSTIHHGFINWSWNADEIERFICAFDDPYPGASTFCNGKRVFIKKVRLDNRDGKFHPFMNGLVYRKMGGLLYVAAKGGSIVIQNIFDEEKNDITKKIKLGRRFVTPQKYLDEALEYYAVYDSKGLKK